MISDAVEQRSGNVPRYARIDVIGGALVVFIACLIWYGAIDLEVGTIADFKSGAIPKVLSVVLLAGGALILLQGLIQPKEQVERAEFAIRPIVIVMIAISIFGLFIKGGRFGIASTPQLGLIVVGPLTVFIAGCAHYRIHAKSLVVLAFALTAAMLVIFIDILGTNIPVFPKFLLDAISSIVTTETATRIAYVFYAAVATLLYIVFYVVAGKNRG